jgi:hypothetical protein
MNEDYKYKSDWSDWTSKNSDYWTDLKKSVGSDYSSTVDYTSALEKRVEKLEKQLDKIVSFLNELLDTNIKTQ